MDGIKVYSIRKNRMKKACVKGMEQIGNGYRSIPGEAMRYVFLGGIDSSEEGTRWGRLSLSLDLEENALCNLHIFAANEDQFIRKGEMTGTDAFLLDPEIPAEIKAKLFEAGGEQVVTNQENCLLYELTGRYLWIYIEVQGMLLIKDMKVSIPGDVFLDTFPEVYQQWGSFFHRYVSVFSSIYTDLQDQIDQVSRKLDLNTAPKELLPVYASWLGLDISGRFLPEEKLRTLVKEAYHLNKIKGTRQSIERIAEIVLDEKVIVKEAEEQDKNPFSVTLMARNQMDEKKKSQLQFLVQQFVPLRCQLNIMYLDEKSVVDSYCYLDMNARIHQGQEVELDRQQRMDDYLAME